QATGDWQPRERDVSGRSGSNSPRHRKYQLRLNTLYSNPESDLPALTKYRGADSARVSSVKNGPYRRRLTRWTKQHLLLAPMETTYTKCQPVTDCCCLQKQPNIVYHSLLQHVEQRYSFTPARETYRRSRPTHLTRKLYARQTCVKYESGVFVYPFHMPDFGGGRPLFSA
ncbi:unnamed protein product, partial [Pylaiella littoralis]